MTSSDAITLKIFCLSLVQTDDDDDHDDDDSESEKNWEVWKNNKTPENSEKYWKLGKIPWRTSLHFILVEECKTTFSNYVMMKFDEGHSGPGVLLRY